MGTRPSSNLLRFYGSVSSCGVQRCIAIFFQGADMGSFSLWHWIILILFLVLNGVPIAKILGRAGLNKWWTIAFLVPFLNLVALWIFAYARWPAVDHTEG
jgi:uncharacterized membrane protein YraQ (UPF0718 family)